MGFDIELYQVFFCVVMFGQQMVRKEGVKTSTEKRMSKQFLCQIYSPFAVRMPYAHIKSEEICAYSDR